MTVSLFHRQQQFDTLWALLLVSLLPLYTSATTFEELKARAQAAGKKHKSAEEIQAKMRNRIQQSKSSYSASPQGDLKNRLFATAVEKAKAGDPNSQFALAGMYCQGMMVRRDYQKALEFYKKAARQGHTKAQYNLATMYYKGIGTPKDIEKARQWFLTAAQNKDTKSYLYLGMIYEEKKKRKEALKWYRLAAQEGYPFAQYKLAHYYHDDNVIPKNLDKYIHYLKLAAAQSEAHAQYDLGIAYLKGDGVPKDRQKAYRWLQKAYINGEKKAKKLLLKLKNEH